jgi:hypothetical protein
MANETVKNVLGVAQVVGTWVALAGAVDAIAPARTDKKGIFLFGATSQEDEARILSYTGFGLVAIPTVVKLFL